MTTSTDPSAVLARVEGDVAAAHERMRTAQDAQTAIAAVRGVGRSRRGDVTVEVDAAGVLTDLRLGDTAVQQSAASLTAAILVAVRDAQVQAGERAVVVAAEAWGEGSAIVEHLREEIAGRHGRRPVLGVRA